MHRVNCPPRPPSAGTDPRSFDHLPARYDRIATLLGRELRAWLLWRLPARGHRALDLGCGTGLWTELLAERYDEVLALDSSAPMLAFARRRRGHPNAVYQQRDIQDVHPVRDGRFDVVLCAHVLHHLPDPLDALGRMRALLRPGGTLVLIDSVDPTVEPTGGAPDSAPAAPDAAADLALTKVLRGGRTDRMTASPTPDPASSGVPQCSPDLRPVSRRRLQADALRTFTEGVWRRRRPPGEALELLRLQLDPDWIEHQAAERLWPAAEWDRFCRAALPGAAISPLRRTRALSWRRPDDAALP